MDTEEAKEALQAPFPPEDIEWRVSRAIKTSKGVKAIVLPYVTNRAIMNRLDKLFGIDGWKNEFEQWREKGTLCRLSIKIGNEWITKSDGADETNIESTKGGFSASMKRTAVQFGIGRYLYDLDEVWVDIKERGENYFNAEIRSGNQKDRIKGYWDTPSLPAWALPKDHHGSRKQTASGVPSDHSQSAQPPQKRQKKASKGTAVIMGKINTLLKNGIPKKQLFSDLVKAVGRKFQDMNDLTDIEQQKIHRLLTQKLEELNKSGETQAPKQEAKCTENQRKALFATANEQGIAEIELREVMVAITGKESTKDLTAKEADGLIKYLKKKDGASENVQEISDEELDDIFRTVDGRGMNIS